MTVHLEDIISDRDQVASCVGLVCAMCWSFFCLLRLVGAPKRFAKVATFISGTIGAGFLAWVILPIIRVVIVWH